MPNKRPEPSSRARQNLSPRDRGAEYLLMGLRLRDGVAMGRYQAMTGATLDSGALEDLSRLGFVEVLAGNVRATDSGRMILNKVIEALSPE